MVYSVSSTQNRCVDFAHPCVSYIVSNRLYELPVTGEVGARFQESSYAFSTTNSTSKIKQVSKFTFANAVGNETVACSTRSLSQSNILTLKSPTEPGEAGFLIPNSVNTTASSPFKRKPLIVIFFWFAESIFNLGVNCVPPDDN